MVLIVTLAVLAEVAMLLEWAGLGETGKIKFKIDVDICMAKKFILLAK